MSLGAHEPSAALQAAIAAAYDAGVTLVAASGNINLARLAGDLLRLPGRRTRPPTTRSSRSRSPATDDKLTGYSCTGPQVDFAAPGDHIFSTVPTGDLHVLHAAGLQLRPSGTSMASPHVAGVVALVLSAGITDANSNGLLADDVKAHLCANTSPAAGMATTDARYPKWYGCGIVDADKALVDNPPPAAGGGAGSAPAAVDDTATDERRHGDRRRGPGQRHRRRRRRADGHRGHRSRRTARRRSTRTARSTTSRTPTTTAPDTFDYTVADSDRADRHRFRRGHRDPGQRRAGRRRRHRVDPRGHVDAHRRPRQRHRSRRRPADAQERRPAGPRHDRPRSRSGPLHAGGELFGPRQLRLQHPGRHDRRGERLGGRDRHRGQRPAGRRRRHCGHAARRPPSSSTSSPTTPTSMAARSSISSVGGASHGTAAIESGQVRYTPAANYAGPDAFDYTVATAPAASTSVPWRSP